MIDKKVMQGVENILDFIKQRKENWIGPILIVLKDKIIKETNYHDCIKMQTSESRKFKADA